MKKPDDKMLGVIMTADEMDELKRYCKDNRISMSAYVRFCLKAGYKRGIVIGDQLAEGGLGAGPQIGDKSTSKA